MVSALTYLPAAAEDPVPEGRKVEEKKYRYIVFRANYFFFRVAAALTAAFAVVVTSFFHPYQLSTYVSNMTGFFT